jgi:acetylornithine deacetylase/succinyl-diaminopimelate desuccinylase-like protein
VTEPKPDSKHEFLNEEITGKIFAYIDEHFNYYVSEIQRYLRQPGISTTGEGIRESATLVLEFLRNAGVTEAHLVETTGNPVVFGRWNSRNPDSKTLLAYTLYDVVPVNPEEWVSPPFAAEIHEATNVANLIGCPRDLGKIIVARGAFNQRAPFLAFLFALKSIRDVAGDIPLNVIFTLDGEEEIASPSWPEFLNRYEKELKTADAAYHHGFRQDESGRHRISCGYKGYTLFELTVRGGEWGGSLSGKDLWAPDILWIDSPLLKLLDALRSLIDAHGRCAIDGFYDNVAKPTEEEKRLYAQIKEEFNEEGIKRARNIRRFRDGKSGKDLIVDWISQPILNIDGLVSGYTGPGFTTSMPMSATAKCDVRIVPDMTLDEFYRKLRQHLDNHGFGMVEIKRIGGLDPGKTPPSHPFIQAAVRATESHKVRFQVWPTSPAGDPMAMYARPPFNLPIMLAGIGHSDKFHVANEWCAVEGIRANMKWTITFLKEWMAA